MPTSFRLSIHYHFTFPCSMSPSLVFDANSIISVSLMLITTCTFSAFVWQNVISANTQLSWSVLSTLALVYLEKTTQRNKFVALLFSRPSLSWALNFALNSLHFSLWQLIVPSLFYSIQPWTLSKGSNTSLSHLVFNSPIFFSWGSSSHWNPPNFCHQSYSLPESESILSSS